MRLARLRIVAGAPLTGTRATLAPARLENLELADLKPPISSTPWCNPAPAGARNPLTTRRHSIRAHALLPGHVVPPDPGGQPLVRPARRNA